MRTIKKSMIIVCLAVFLATLALFFIDLHLNKNVNFHIVINLVIWGLLSYWLFVFRYFKLRHIKRSEYITCSAIWFDDDRFHDHQPFNIKTGYVICGHRHHNCLTSVVILGSKKSFRQTQGFMTNKNNFVDRITAASIAYESGQIAKYKITLYSEDIY